MSDFTHQFKQRGKGIGLIILALFELAMAGVGFWILTTLLSGDSGMEFQFGPIGALAWVAFVVFLFVGGLTQIVAGITGIAHPALEFRLEGKKLHCFRSVIGLFYNGSKPLEFDLATCEVKVKVKNGGVIYTLKGPQGKCQFTANFLKADLVAFEEARKR